MLPIHVVYRAVRCPECRAFVEAHLYFVSTNLGPPFLQCRKCGNVFASGRTEWPAAGALGKARFVVVSLLHVVVVGVVGGVFMVILPLGVLGLLKEGVPGWPAMALFATAALILQIYRVRSSVERAGNPAPWRVRFWTFQANLQTQFLVLVLAAIASNALMALLRGLGRLL